MEEENGDGGGLVWGKSCDESRGIWLFLGRDPAKRPGSLGRGSRLPRSARERKGWGCCRRITCCSFCLPFFSSPLPGGCGRATRWEGSRTPWEIHPCPRLNAPTPLLPPSSPCLPPPHFLLRPNSPGSAQEQPCSRSTGMRLNFCAMATSSREGDDCGRRAGTVPGVFPPSSLFGQARRC